MKYFLDTEFIEGFHKPLFGKRRHFIDLISIGIVAEDGRRYEAVSNEYNYKDASGWVVDNVLVPLYKSQQPMVKQFRDVNTFHKMVGKSNAQIAQEIISFVNPVTSFAGYHVENKVVVDHQLAITKRMRQEFKAHNVGLIEDRYYVQPEFWGYYSDYDWVLFCSLFGSMMDLPKGFPMLCMDLKHAIQARQITQGWIDGNCPQTGVQHTSIGDALWIKAAHEKIEKHTRNNP